VGGQRNQSWIITKGLTPNAKVIVDGMGQMAMMRGAKKVQTRPWGSDQPVDKSSDKPSDKPTPDAKVVGE